VEAAELCGEAKSAMEDYILAIEAAAPPRTSNLEALLDAVRETLNLWMTKVSFEIKFRTAPELDPTDTADHNFVYFGPISSHLEADDLRIADTLKNFRDALVRSLDRVDREKAIQCASWLYRACPDALVDLVRRDFKDDDDVRPPQLAFAGNVFSEQDDIRLFFKRFCVEIRRPRALPPNNWLRAYRNIARFRPDGVHPEVLSRQDQDTISLFVYRTLKAECENQNFKRKFDNCLYVLPHMLKRRRHDKRFLDDKSGLGPKFEKLLLAVIERAEGGSRLKPKPGQARRANAIVELLRFEASESTLHAIDDDD
ncbi:hypothetical protein MK280_12575, partial [Myxococcota bacterium]|nr:hypothetical protein [Myxococcota bacterium]